MNSASMRGAVRLASTGVGGSMRWGARADGVVIVPGRRRRFMCDGTESARLRRRGLPGQVRSGVSAIRASAGVAGDPALFTYLLTYVYKI